MKKFTVETKVFKPFDLLELFEANYPEFKESKLVFEASRILIEAEEQPGAQPTQKQIAFVQKIFGGLIEKLSQIKDPNFLIKALRLIATSSDSMDAISKIGAAKKEAEAIEAQAAASQQGVQEAAAVNEELLHFAVEEIARSQGLISLVEIKEELTERFPNSSKKAIDLASHAAFKSWGLDDPTAPVDEGLWDRGVSKAVGWAQGGAAAVKNLSNKISGDQTAQKQSVLGAFSTGKFSQLIKQYITKVERFAAKVQMYANSVQDVQEQKTADEMAKKINEFIKAARAALKDSKEELKKSGYDRSAKVDDKKDDSEKEQAAPDGSEGKDEEKVDESFGVDFIHCMSDIPSDPTSDIAYYRVTDIEWASDDTDSLLPDKLVVKVNHRVIDPDSTEYKVQDALEEEFNTGVFGFKLRDVDPEQIDEGWFKNAAQFVGGVAKGLGQAAKTGVKNAIATTKGAGKELSAKAADRFNNLANGKGFTATVNCDTLATDLSRIIGELEMDLKDCGWSEKRNPQLAKVINDLETSLDTIHKKGAKGTVTNLDKIRHGTGKLAAGIVQGTATGLILGGLTGWMRRFMSPRAHAALVAAAVVLLRAVLRNIQNMDVNLDKKEEAAAMKAVQGSQPAVSENQQISLTRKQLARLIKEETNREVDENWLTDKLGDMFHWGKQKAKAANAKLDQWHAQSQAKKQAAAQATPPAANPSPTSVPKTEPAPAPSSPVPATVTSPAEGEPVNSTPPALPNTKEISAQAKGIASGLKLSQYITPVDVAAAISAGVVAYIRNHPKGLDDTEPEASDAASDATASNTATDAATQAATTSKGPAWGSQDWRDEMIRQGKMVQRDGVYFHVNKSGQPLEAYKFFKGGSYAKMPIKDADPFDIGDGSEGWWNFDKAKAILVSPDGSKQPLDGDYLGRLEGVLDKHFADGAAMRQVGAEVRRAAAAASGLDPEVAAAKGLHDGTGKAFAGAANTASTAPATGAPVAGTPTINTGFSATNLPTRFDTSPNAQTFWLEHPDLAKANGITITGRSASTAFNPTGYTRHVSGTISHVPPEVRAKLAGNHAAVQAAMNARAAEYARL